MGPLLTDTFTGYDCHVFVISVGAVVRMIAPLLVNKKVDPAVLCIDDANRFTICVLSGHVGRGNSFTDRVAELLGNQPVITTASDVLGTLTVDILGRELGWTLDDPDRNVTRACAAVVNASAGPVRSGDRRADILAPGPAAAAGRDLRDMSLDDVDPAAYEVLLIASDRTLQRSHPAHYDNAVIYRPRSLVVGIGCDRDTPAALIERGLERCVRTPRPCPRVHQRGRQHRQKAGRAGAAGALCGPPIAVSRVFRGDAGGGRRHRDAVGRRGESTWARAGCASPRLLLAAGASELLVPKQIYTEPGAHRSMTVAVARIPFAARPPAPQPGVAKVHSPHDAALSHRAEPPSQRAPNEP